MSVNSDTTRLAPSQREVFRVLRESDDELKRGEITEQADRMSDRAVGRALEKLLRDGLIQKRVVDPRGWYGYCLARENRGEDA